MTKANPVRDDGTVTPQGLKRIEEMAAAGRSQATIASELGVPKREFEQMLAKAKGNNPVRLAWEAGHARHEQELHDRLWHSAMGVEKITYEDEPLLDAETGKPIIDEKTGQPKTERIKVRTVYVSKGATIEALFLAKTQFGWKEGESEQAKASNTILVLPKSRTRAEYFAMLGIPDPQANAEPMKVVHQVPLAPKPALPAPPKGVTR